MKLRREASLGLGAMLLLQMSLSSFAIVLLTRMSPAIEHILEENVYSGEAVEDMLSVLATTSTSESLVGAHERFDAALQRARNNVTEEAEPALIDAIARDTSAAFDGDDAAMQRVVASLRALAQVNRTSMMQADQRAQRLGQAGAWAAALLGAASLGLGILVYRRLRVRLELPIERVRRTLMAVRGGNGQARSMTGEAPLEISQISDDVNWLLDERGVMANACTVKDDPLPRRALVAMLERVDGPAVIVAADGTRIAVNVAALDHLARDGADLDDDEVWRAVPLADGALRLLTASEPTTPSDPVAETA